MDRICKAQTRAAGEDSEQYIKIHDKMQRCGKNAAEWGINQGDDRHCAISVEERCEADQGKVSVELKQIKETNGNWKEEQSNDKRKESPQPSDVCVRREHGAQVRGL